MRRISTLKKIYGESPLMTIADEILWLIEVEEWRRKIMEARPPLLIK